MSIVNLSLRRRAFLGVGAAAGAMLLGFHLPSARAAAGERSVPGIINAFIAVDADGVVTIFCPFVEMGQGTYTSIPALIAEELDVDMASVRVVQAPHGAQYKVMFNNTVRFTGGSLSVRSSFEALRRAGASARAMLMAAAADQWRIGAGELHTEPGFVVHGGSGRRLAYAALAPAAAKLVPPQEVQLKAPKNFRLIGKPVPRIDALEKSNGRAVFGIDVQAEEMLVASVRHAPVFGASIGKLDRNSIATMKGVVAVEEVPGGVAVIADNYWHAKQAADALVVEFGGAPRLQFSSQQYLATLQSRLDEAGIPAEVEGDVPAAFASGGKLISADYDAPFLSHATMEPQNCTALVKDGRCTVWAPNQGVDFVAQVASRITGLPLDAIDVRTPYLGGGFGRRFITDFVTQAVTLAHRHPGHPVKLVWSREEDTQHDFYRPMIAARCRAVIDASGRPLALHVTLAGDGPGRRHSFEPMKETDLDETMVEGALHQPYAIPNRRCDYVFEYAPPPIGYWRSVGNSHNAFFKESFMDEMAHAAGSDPVEFRRRLLKTEPRFRKVLDTAVAMANWRGEKWRAADGRERAMGVALHRSFGSIVAEIAEVSLNDAGAPHVHQVWATVDCGFAVNPLIVVHQMESAIAYGLSAALHEEIRIEQGRVVNANFDSYPILTAQEMPEVDVEIINGGEPMGGIGEVGTPPIAPAVCNAIFPLTGKRVRSLPIRPLMLA